MTIHISLKKIIINKILYLVIIYIENTSLQVYKLY
jgi:hypothetical protein